MPDIESCAVALPRERNNATDTKSATNNATAITPNISKPASLQELRAQLRAQLARNYSGNRDDGKQAELRSCAPSARNTQQAEIMTADNEATIRSWLAHIEETDPEIIAEVLDKCRTDLEARAYFLHRAEEVPSPVARGHQVTCGGCHHFERIKHPHLGHCAQGEPEAVAGLWDTDSRWCDATEET